ncbi:MAG: hypothetical protein H6654_13340 [Ardenticatenaceae bacterium]|nr:hypothetical protein [Anaerolineales bacterium]MCB8941569.1 hypothetical protein [Ardenticatenaceae bacterium]MCB8974537.1 hypothetical protein [Ardenticatenaceae bacterium]
MSFEWRTDEDEGWSEEGSVKETAVPNQPFLRRRWRFLLGSLLGLLAVWLVVQWQIDQRVAETTATIETELLATHNFVLQTAVSQDNDLFRANLSGRNPDWTELQKRLFADGLLLDRPMLGWQHLASADRLAAEDVTITLDPELRTAELRYSQTYAVQTAAGITETVTLAQTAVYRQGTSRWLYSPPDDDFWGDWITYGGDYLTLVYTERDREVAVLLGVQLDRLLSQMCTELQDLNCDPDFKVHLRFDTDPQSLLVLNEVETMLKAGIQLELPTPTLIGLPTDEASAEVLYRAYGVQVATAVLAHQIEYDCCRHQLFFRALRDYQLDQLGLQTWPLTPAMYQQMLDVGFNGDVARHWTRRWEEAPPQFLQVWVIEDPDPIWQQVYMLVEFLAGEETAVSPTQMMRLMDRNNYDNWLADVLQDGTQLSTLESRFLGYIHAQTIAGQQAEPPIPLPQGSITLVCESYTDVIASRIYSYNLAKQTWTEPFPGEFAESYISLVDGEHFVVNEYNFAEDLFQWKSSLVIGDEIIFLEEAESENGADYWLYYFFADAAAKYLLRYEHDEGQTNIGLLPVACAGDGCAPVPLDGFPTFAPNKDHFFVLVYPTDSAEFELDVPRQLQPSIVLMTPDGQQRQLLGRGGTPFWLNDTVYGYVQTGEEGWELVTAVITQNQPRYLLSQTELLAELQLPTDLITTQVVANLSNPQELLLQLRHQEDVDAFATNVPSYLVKLTLTPDLGEIETADWLRDDLTYGAMNFSVDGRYIIYGELNPQSLNTAQHFLNIETGQTELSFNSNQSLSGSDDGQWYLQVAENYVMLHAPQYDYQQFIPHNFGECQQAALSEEE